MVVRTAATLNSIGLLMLAEKMVYCKGQVRTAGESSLHLCADTRRLAEHLHARAFRIFPPYRERFPNTDLPGLPMRGRDGFGVAEAAESGSFSFGSVRDSVNAPLAERGLRTFGLRKARMVPRCC